MRRSGIHYTPTYATTIVGAIRQAEKKGWISFADDPSWDTKPSTASIYERYGEGWELVATVSAKGVETVDCLNRRSVKHAMETILRMQAVIAESASVMAEFNKYGNVVNANRENKAKKQNAI